MLGNFRFWNVTFYLNPILSLMISVGGDILEKYVNAYIDFPKPLVGVINGPAVGVAVTVLGLFDAVYATNSATFHTPFSALGQSPEGCSSDLFPKILGPLKVCFRTLRIFA